MQVKPSRAHMIILLALTVMLSGCTAAFSNNQSSPTTSTVTTTPSTPTESNTEPSSGNDITTHSLEDNNTYLRLYRIDNSTAMELSKNERIHFENLSKDRQSVFLEALEQDEVKLDGEFVFNEEDRRIKVVLYNGVYYRLNVAKY